MHVPWTGDYLSTKFRLALKKESPIVIVLAQLDETYFNGLEGIYNYELQFRVRKADDPDESNYIIRSHGNYAMSRSVSTDFTLEAGDYIISFKVKATRDDARREIEDVLASYAEKKPEKLMQVGLSYDMAHAKGVVAETEQEKKDREAREKTQRAKDRERYKKEMRRQAQKRYEKQKKAHEREKRRKAKERKARAKRMAQGRRLSDGDENTDSMGVANGSEKGENAEKDRIVIRSFSGETIMMETRWKGEEEEKFVVHAGNLAPGTTLAEVESALKIASPDSAGPTGLKSCRILSTEPTVTAELVFDEKVAAETAISQITGQTIEGRKLELSMEKSPPGAEATLANGTTLQEAAPDLEQDSVSAAVINDTKPRTEPAATTAPSAADSLVEPLATVVAKVDAESAANRATEESLQHSSTPKVQINGVDVVTDVKPLPNSPPFAGPEAEVNGHDGKDTDGTKPATTDLHKPPEAWKGTRGETEAADEEISDADSFPDFDYDTELDLSIASSSSDHDGHDHDGSSASDSDESSDSDGSRPFGRRRRRTTGGGRPGIDEPPPPPNVISDDEEDALKVEPWNAVVTVGLRVYSVVGAEDIAVEVVRPALDGWDEDAERRKRSRERRREERRRARAEKNKTTTKDKRESSGNDDDNDDNVPGPTEVLDVDDPAKGAEVTAATQVSVEAKGAGREEGFVVLSK